MHTLVLLRHAKSGYPDGVDDHDRPLAARGEHEAPVAGRLLGAFLASEPGDGGGPGAGVDLVLVSSALRAQQTWKLAAEGVGAVRQAQTRAELYLASADELLGIVHDLPKAAATVIVVGHNDGLELLASALSATAVRLKTSTYAVLQSPLPWSQWTAGGVDLVDVVVAR